MPHLPMPEQTYEFGKQWRADADWSTSKTSSEYAPGRGFPGGATPQPMTPRMLDEPTLARVMARMKLAGTTDIRDCGCPLDTPPHRH